MHEPGCATTVGLIGQPVGHSLSPVIQGAGFRALNLNWQYLLREVAPEELGLAVATLRDAGWRGWNVTLPHKRAIIPYLDGLTDIARRTGAVNTVINDAGRLTGDNTDVTGFGHALIAAGWQPEAHEKKHGALIIGAGGAARAAVVWLVGQGVPVRIVNRTPERAQELAAEQESVLVTAVPGSHCDAALLSGCSLIIQATSSGRKAEQWLPFAWADVPRDTLCFDLNYDLREPTPFCSQAAASGLTATDGLRMLVEQAAVAFSRWTDLAAPLPAMLDAVARR